MKFLRFIFLFLCFCFSVTAMAVDLTERGEMPDFKGVETWLNNQALSKEALKGKVVLVDFWTFSCVNCARTFPHLVDWYKKYKDQGFEIVGVHTPEFDHEKDLSRIKQAIDKFQITYPVAVDNQMKTWFEYGNIAWPTHYFIDARGQIRHVHLGEGRYEEQEKVIKKLLKEASAGKKVI